VGGELAHRGWLVRRCAAAHRRGPARHGGARS